MLKVEGIDLSSDRGDGPAQAVLQENSRARSLRKVAETQEELAFIRERVAKVQGVIYKQLSLFYIWNK